MGRIKSIENLELPVKSVEAKPVEPKTIKIKVEGDEKAFNWNAGKTVTENVRELVGAYLENTDYHHTRARKSSAQKVLDKIRELSEGEKAISDPLRRDAALVEFLRGQKDTFSVFGFNRKESQLHAIYRQAEVQLKNRVEQSFGTNIVEAMEIAKNNKELERELASLKKINQKFSTPIDRSEQEQRPADSARPMTASAEKGGSQDSKVFEREHQQILGELHAQNAKQFTMSSEELGIVTSSEAQLVQLDAQKADLRRALIERQKEVAGWKEELNMLNMGGEQLLIKARILYLETSQLAKKLGRENDFNKHPEWERADSNILMLTVTRFLKNLARELSQDGGLVVTPPRDSESPPFPSK